jgi:hypothetical protein
LSKHPRYIQYPKAAKLELSAAKPSILSSRIDVMHEFTVTTGTLKITIVAESAHDAALEAVQIWQAPSSKEMLTQRDAAHRANLDPLTSVTRIGFATRRGIERRFATFNLLAAARQESPQEAWDRVLQKCVSSKN